MEFSDIKDWFYRQIKEAPNAKTGYIVPYYTQELIPSAKKYLYENRETLKKLSRTKLNIHMMMYITKYNLKNYPKYLFSRNVNRTLNRKN